MKKIEPAKQLILLSLLYGFYPEDYTYLECDNYIKMISNMSQKNVFRSVLINEWDALGRARYSEEKRIESILKFV